MFGYLLRAREKILPKFALESFGNGCNFNPLQIHKCQSPTVQLAWEIGI